MRRCGGGARGGAGLAQMWRNSAWLSSLPLSPCPVASILLTRFSPKLAPPWRGSESRMSLFWKLLQVSWPHAG